MPQTSAAEEGRGEAGTASRPADWIAGLRFEDLPEDVIGDARLCFIDSVACLIGGLALEPSRKLLGVLQAAGGAGEVRIPGSRHRLGLLQAAYFGAQTANALDFDDSSTIGHPGATIVPPALVLADLRDASGRELLTAVICGYEVSQRIGRAIAPTYERKQQVSGHSTWQSFGAMAAAARLVGLSAEAARHAFGLTGAQAPVPPVRKFIDGVRPYTWIKNAYGAAAETGTLSVLLAEAGYRGNQEIFDGPHGFWIMAGSDRYRRELLTEGLGQTWFIRDVGFKFYACCRWTQTILDAAETMRREIDPSQVEVVDVHGFREISLRFGGALPDDIIDAQFNAPFLAALQLLGRSPARGLDEADLKDPQVLALARKVRLHHDPIKDQGLREQGQLPVTLSISMSDRRRLSASCDDPTGSKARGGFSMETMRDKFMQVVAPVLGMSKAQDAFGMMMELERHQARSILSALQP